MAASPNPTVPEGATKEERVDFLKQVIAFTEANIRSYDTKAQIALAAFVLSANPLVTITTSACSQDGGRTVMMVLVLAYFATVLAHLWVLWPVGQLLERLTEGLKSQNIFFMRDPTTVSSLEYAERLSKLSMEPELTAEAFKLAHIRRIKASRFKNALGMTLATYVVIAVSLFFVGRCF